MHSNAGTNNKQIWQVLKTNFAVFLTFSRAGFAYLVKEHSELCFLKEKAKDGRQKQKYSEEQYKEQHLYLCGDFLEHAFNLTSRKGYKIRT